MDVGCQTVLTHYLYFLTSGRRQPSLVHEVAMGSVFLLYALVVQKIWVLKGLTVFPFLSSPLLSLLLVLLFEVLDI